MFLRHLHLKHDIFDLRSGFDFGSIFHREDKQVIDGWRMRVPEREALAMEKPRAPDIWGEKRGGEGHRRLEYGLFG